MTTCETYKILKEKSDIEKVSITKSTDTYNFVKNFYFEDINVYESFFLILLTRQLKTKGWVKISQGGCTGTIVDIKLIMKYVVDSLTSKIIVCHNHPSGDTKPSFADIEITKKIKEAAKYFDCELMDHIILSDSLYFSFADEGIL